MHILIVLAHPDPGSFNHAIANAARESLENCGHRVTLRDLYDEGFDPALTTGEIPTDGEVPSEILRDCEQLAEADGIVIVHPNWWGMPPAVLKGWVDRVFRPEVAYRFLEGDSGEGVPQGLLKTKAAMVFNTANTVSKREADVFGDPLETIWRNCIFGLCGITDFRRETFAIVATSSQGEREGWLARVRARVRRMFPPGPEGCCG